MKPIIKLRVHVGKDGKPAYTELYTKAIGLLTGKPVDTSFYIASNDKCSTYKESFEIFMQQAKLYWDTQWWYNHAMRNYRQTSDLYPNLLDYYTAKIEGFDYYSLPSRNPNI